MAVSISIHSYGILWRRLSSDECWGNARVVVASCSLYRSTLRYGKPRCFKCVDVRTALRVPYPHRLNYACSRGFSIFVSIHRSYVYINLPPQHHVFQISALFPQMPIHRRTCFTCGRHCSPLAHKIYRCGRCLYARKPFTFLFSANIV